MSISDYELPPRLPFWQRVWNWFFPRKLKYNLEIQFRGINEAHGTIINPHVDTLKIRKK